MKTASFCLVLSTLLAWAFPAAPAQAVTELGFQVVVHADNPLDAIPRAQLARMYMNKASRWDDGTPVQVVDLPLGHRARLAFSEVVHGKSVEAVNSYWQRMIFSGRGVPPAQMSERELLDYICSQRGAIGYLDCNTSLKAGAKRIDVLGDDGEVLRLVGLTASITSGGVLPTVGAGEKEPRRSEVMPAVKSTEPRRRAVLHRMAVLHRTAVPHRTAA